MTTIATDGKLMAGDGRSTRGDSISGGDRKKVFQLRDGSIIGIAGRTRDAELAARKFIENPDSPENVRGDYTVVRLYPNGQVWVYEDNTSVAIKVKPPYAIGSGWTTALGALLAGANAAEAVKIASKVDVHTGGKITSFSI